ncbi:MAG: xylulokinase [Actinomycetota bacterium]|nr:xylulokinase [Actinomycetota bacterium]MDQ1478448.1 xylulokinase [Actinomycetota bacterium]
MTEYVLTIDLGTSGPKVALFTFDGAFVDGDFTPVDLNVLPDGGAEQSPAAWWSGVVGASQRVMGRATIRPEEVVAVAVTSQWSGTVPIARDGTVLHDAIIWMDARGADETRRVVGGAVRLQGYEPRKLRTWIRRTGGAPALSGKDSISHIHWLQRERPDVARATWKYLEPKDWLNYELTGRCTATHDSIVLHWVTDNRDAARVDYDPDLLQLAELNRAQLPDLVPATSVVGPLTEKAARELGLPVGIAVVGGTPDLQSAAIGSGAVRDFEGHLYVGTSSWLTCHVPFKKTDLFHGIATLPSPLPGKYYVADEQEVAGGCLEWLKEHAFETSDDLRRLDALAGSVAAGSNGVIFTPWLNGERTPVDDHTLRAGWNNLSLATTRAELVRSVLEGVAYNSRWLLATVEKFVGRPFPWLHFIGGGAQSELWCQIMADVLGREIRQVEHPIRANARGVALLAGIALGRIGVDDLARNVRILETFVPDPAHRPMYDDRYAEFRVLHKQTSRRTKRHARHAT